MNTRSRTILFYSIYALFVFGGMGYLWWSFLRIEEPKDIAFSELIEMDDLHKMKVRISGFEMVGSPITAKFRPNHLYDFVPVRVAGPSNEDATPNCHAKEFDATRMALIILDRHKTEKPIAHWTADGTFRGFVKIFDEKADCFGEKFKAELTSLYPEADLDHFLVIRHNKPIPNWCWVVMSLFTIYAIISVPLLYWYMLSYSRRALQGHQAWRDKICEDRTEVYRNHKHAMRLVSYNDPLKGNSLSPRQTDVTFDVSQPKTIKQLGLKKFIWRVGIVLAFTMAGGAVQFAVEQSEWLGALGKFANHLFAMFLFSGIAIAAQACSGKTTDRQEEPIEKPKAKYRELGFHEYHHQVLMELGFHEVGDFRLLGVPTNLRRTIYFSPQKNLLVEVGIESGGQFFTLESLLNDGKFLETHSMLKPSQEKFDIHSNFLRRSASHADIVLALEEHDQFISEMNYGGTVLEAEYSQENFGRFLSWHSRKSIQQQVVQTHTGRFDVK